jgi:hypothetical protein
MQQHKATLTYLTLYSTESQGPYFISIHATVLKTKYANRQMDPTINYAPILCFVQRTQSINLSLLTSEHVTLTIWEYWILIPCYNNVESQNLTWGHQITVQ